MELLFRLVNISADRPDRDGSWRSVTMVTDGDISWHLFTLFSNNDRAVARFLAECD